MGSGRESRNQGSGKTGPVSREDTGSCESCQQVGMVRAWAGSREGGEMVADMPASAHRVPALYRTARTRSHDLRAGCRLAPWAPEGA